MPSPASSPVWIDTDPSIGLPLHDADDAFALALAFHSPEISILGISTTYGNASLHRTDATTRTILQIANLPHIEVHRGAPSPQHLGPTPARDALIKTLEGSPVPVTYLALGPLTNLAALLHLRPDLAPRLRQVIFVGGRTPGVSLRIGNVCPYQFHDANFEKDPAAASSLLSSNIPIQLVPIELSAGLRLLPTHLRQIGKSSGPLAQFLAQRGALWMKQWQWLVWLDGAPVFDVLAVLLAARPDQVLLEPRTITIDPTTHPPQLHALPSPTSHHHFATATQHTALPIVLTRLTALPPSRERYPPPGNAKPQLGEN